MRLICPNCSAQYEVPEDVIPDEGRDVQCSSCGDTWFQESASHSAAQTEPVAADVEQPNAAASPTSEPELPAEPQTAEAPHSDVQTDPNATERDVTAPASPETSDQAGSTGVTEDTSPAQDATPPSPPLPDQTELRQLAPEIARILREEAEREAALRAGQHSTLETQTEFGLSNPTEPQPDPQAQQAEERVAEMMAEAASQPPSVDAPVPPASRRGLLPDIEEINSSLHKSNKPAAVHASHAGPSEEAFASDGAPARSNGFTRGFALVVCIVAVAMVVYKQAPSIAHTLPQADPFLSNYVAWVDQARIWLDAKAQAMANE